MSPLHATLASWQNFYILAGTAAATLMGLMFVAITFGARLVTRQSLDTARAFIDPTYAHFGQVALMALVMLVPSLTGQVLGGVMVAIGLGRMASLPWVVRQVRLAHQQAGDIEAADWAMMVAAPAVLHAALAAAGAGLFTGVSGSLELLCATTLALLALGALQAWELMVWMAVELGRDEARK